MFTVLKDIYTKRILIINNDTLFPRLTNITWDQAKTFSAHTDEMAKEFFSLFLNTPIQQLYIKNLVRKHSFV